MMNYTKEAFEYMNKGKFIVSDSYEPEMKSIYEDIDDNFEEYNTFFEHLGLFIERGDGYFSLCRKETRMDLERKIKVYIKWIKLYSFLISYHSSFRRGTVFTKSSIEEKMHDDAEVRDKGLALFDEKTQSDIVEKVIKMLADVNFIEELSASEGKYRVTAAFNYLENLIECINIEADVEDEIPE